MGRMDTPTPNDEDENSENSSDVSLVARSLHMAISCCYPHSSCSGSPHGPLHDREMSGCEVGTKALV